MDSQTESRTAAQDDQIDLLDIFVVLAENARLLIIGPILAGLVALGIAFAMRPSFTATTRILPPQQQQSAATMLASQLGALAGVAGMAGVNIKSPADTYVALLRSRTVADRLIDRFDLLKTYEKPLREDARRVLEGVTRISAGKDGLIVIDVEDHDPKRASALANAYVDELYKLTGSLSITEAQHRRAFFEKQLKQAQADLRQAEVALGQTGAGESLLKSAPQAVVESIARLKAQVSAQEIRISTMRTYLTDSNPDLQRAQRELESLRTQLSQAERNQPANARSSEYLNRYRDFKYNETLFELMAKQYELARLDEAREGAVIQVVDPAAIPERKSKPKRAVIAVVTTIASAVLLLIFVLLRQWVRHAATRGGSAKIQRIRTAFFGGRGTQNRP